MVKRHVFDGERCIHCGVNTYDCTCENDECCNEREPMVHTSQSEPCPRCKGTGCITETSIACRGCCPDCQQPVLSWSSESPEHRAAVRAYADSLPAKHVELP